MPFAPTNSMPSAPVRVIPLERTKRIPAVAILANVARSRAALRSFLIDPRLVDPIGGSHHFSMKAENAERIKRVQIVGLPLHDFTETLRFTQSTYLVSSGFLYLKIKSYSFIQADVTVWRRQNRRALG